MQMAAVIIIPGFMDPNLQFIDFKWLGHAIWWFVYVTLPEDVISDNCYQCNKHYHINLPATEVRTFWEYDANNKAVDALSPYVTRTWTAIALALLWRHNGPDGVSNHQPHDCLLNRSFRCRLKKISKLHFTGLCGGNSPVTGEFPAQMASNAEKVSIWWYHHGLGYNGSCLPWQLQYFHVSLEKKSPFKALCTSACTFLFITHSWSKWYKFYNHHVCSLTEIETFNVLFVVIIAF